MGRYSTGAWTCEGAQSIELSFLFKKGFLKEGEITMRTLIFLKGEEVRGQITVLGCMQEKQFIRLMYTSTNTKTGEETPYNYKIELTSVPSNLGKGKIWYFLCPETGKRCRVLYSAYNYPKWKSREAYQNRLYYASQLSSKMNYANDRYWALNKKIKRLKASKKHYHHMHQGKLTTHAVQLFTLKWKQEKWENERMQLKNMPYCLRQMMAPLYPKDGD